MPPHWPYSSPPTSPPWLRPPTRIGPPPLDPGLPPTAPRWPPPPPPGTPGHYRRPPPSTRCSPGPTPSPPPSLSMLAPSPPSPPPPDRPFVPCDRPFVPCQSQSQHHVNPAATHLPTTNVMLRSPIDRELPECDGIWRCGTSRCLRCRVPTTFGEVLRHRHKCSVNLRST